MKLEIKALEENNTTEIAYQFGYESMPNSISAFKSIYGITPKQYQIQNKKYKYLDSK